MHDARARSEALSRAYADLQAEYVGLAALPPTQPAALLSSAALVDPLCALDRASLVDLQEPLSRVDFSAGDAGGGLVLDMGMGFVDWALMVGLSGGEDALGPDLAAYSF